MTPIKDKSGNTVSNLFIRGRRIYFRKAYSAKTYLRATPVTTSGTPTQEQIRTAQQWAKSFDEMIFRGEVEKITATKRRSEYATINQLVDCYRRACHANGNPRPETVVGNVRALERIIQTATGKAPASQSTNVLTKETLRAYQTAKLAEDGDNPRTRRTILSTIIQARCVTQKRLAQDYDICLPDLSAWRDAWLGSAPIKHVPLPAYDLRRKTALAARKLWLDRSPLYAVYALAYYAGMRSDEIANAKWTWIEEHRGQKRISIRDREVEQFQIKGVRPGNVPLYPAVIKRLRAVGGKDYILAGNNYTFRKNMIQRDFSRWMTGLGWDGLDTSKRAHELRRLFGSRVWVKHGKEECFQRMRHTSFSTTEKHYLNLNLDLRARELAGI